jgi:membrane protein YdbS with pleckstrin-like domain
MNCHRCGNQLTRESQYCNRCGAKVQDIASRRRASHLAVPPPRPARRAPIIPSDSDLAPSEDYQEEIQEEYYDDRYRDSADDNEVEIFSITPAFYEVGLAYFCAVLLSLLTTAGVAYAQAPLWTAMIAGAIFFSYPVIQHIKLKHTVYTLTNIKIEIRSGLFSTSARNIPLRHIQDVTVSETFKEKLIGIGDVLIDSAAMEGNIAMSNIKNPRRYADLILDQLQYWY